MLSISTSLKMCRFGKGLNEEYTSTCWNKLAKYRFQNKHESLFISCIYTLASKLLLIVYTNLSKMQNAKRTSLARFRHTLV